jgi:hypothetical protein
MRIKRSLARLFFAAAVLAGCATGRPLVIADLDEIGWDHAAAFQCYLSSRLTLARLPDDTGPAVNFGREGDASIREAGGAVELSASLEGRILDYHKRDQYLYVAFEEGSAALPFARDKNGRFSLMSTIDQKGVEFVEYDGARYKPGYAGPAPHLNVVINRSRGDFQYQMQGTKTGAAAKLEDVVKLGAEKFTGGLPEGTSIAVVNVSAADRNSSAFILEELEFQLVESGKFRVVERKRLDEVRAERNFQVSAEVSDESAVSIGNQLGAEIVITGAVSGSGGDRRLTLKALKVETGEVVVIVREQF